MYANIASINKEGGGGGGGGGVTSRSLHNWGCSHRHAHIHLPNRFLSTLPKCVTPKVTWTGICAKDINTSQSKMKEIRTQPSPKCPLGEGDINFLCNRYKE